jgi:hypothetical protein
MEINLPENWCLNLEFHILCDRAAIGLDPDLPLRPGGVVHPDPQAADCPSIMQ